MFLGKPGPRSFSADLWIRACRSFFSWVNNEADGGFVIVTSGIKYNMTARRSRKPPPRCRKQWRDQWSDADWYISPAEPIKSPPLRQPLPQPLKECEKGLLIAYYLC